MIQLNQSLFLPELLDVGAFLLLLLHFLTLLILSIFEAFDAIVMLMFTVLVAINFSVKPQAFFIFETFIEIGRDTLVKRVIILLYFVFQSCFFDLHNVPRVLLHLLDFFLMSSF